MNLLRVLKTPDSDTSDKNRLWSPKAIIMGSLAETTSLSMAVESAIDHYTSSNPKSYKQYLDSTHYLPGGNTRTVLHTSPFPLTFSSGSGATLTDLDGHTYIDFLGEYTAGIYGHNHPVIRAAVESALDRGWNYGGHSGLETELAKVICERFNAIELVRFVNSGTEANMMAVATAIAWKELREGKGCGKKVLVFEKGYHGSTISGRGDKSKVGINLPHEFVVGRFNDVDGVERLVGDLERGSLAAVLVEPVMGSGGCFEARKDFMQCLKRVSEEHGALLMFDEVMTSRLGYGGKGKEFDEAGVKPDLMTLGKWVGGGMSFGAFGGRREIMDLYDPRSGKLEHPGTFNNNVFSMSAGIVGCGLMTKDMIDELNERGVWLRETLNDVFRSHGSAGTGLQWWHIPDKPFSDTEHESEKIKRWPKAFVSGEGSMMCFHFIGPEKAMLQTLFFHWMLSKGIYLAQRGFVALNIMITDDHVFAFADATRDFCKEHGDLLSW